MMHAVYEGRKQRRLPAYGLHHLIGATDGAPIAAPEFIQDGELCAHRQTSFTLRQSDGPGRDIEHIRRRAKTISSTPSCSLAWAVAVDRRYHVIQLSVVFSGTGCCGSGTPAN